MIIKTNQPLFSERNTITKRIANFWDNISAGWLTIWGPHIHHGYYEDGKSLTPIEAQENLIEKLIQTLAITSRAKILDAGCGMGGSSLYLAKNYQAIVTGITLSEQQVVMANQLSCSEQIKDVSFKVEDALSMNSFTANSFDIVWSLESCEQFYDKKLFIQQAYRVLKPGGKLLLATWCADKEEYEGNCAQQYRKLCFAFDLPYMPTLHYYATHLQAQGFELKACLDWSNQVKKSWNTGITLAKHYSWRQLLKLGGWRGLRFARQLKLMRTAFEQERVRYGVLIAIKTKPDGTLNFHR